MNNKAFVQSKRKHICLITNHGYAGVDIPIGGAPDSGGQIIYVNDYAKALDKLGYKVTIFTRGGFPFFDKKKIRKGVEFLSEYSRYVYVSGGGDSFILKEDIGNVLDEEVTWIYKFVEKEAQEQNKIPYNYFWFINSHYWDAAIIIYKLIKRWQSDLFIKYIKKMKFNKDVMEGYLKSRHKLNLSNNINYFTGMIFFQHLKHTVNNQIPDNIEMLNHREEIITGLKKIVNIEGKFFNIFFNEVIRKTRNLIKPVIFTFIIEGLGKFILEKNSPEIYKKIDSLNKHLWTPHSLGSLKERNYWDKNNETKRKLKFLERNCYEQIIINNTPAIVATSNEIIRVSKNYYNSSLNNILYFPPCNDETVFKPRKKTECKDAFSYFSDITGINKDELMNKRIIFETSRMDYTKRKDILIQAFKKIYREYDDVILIIGGGPKNSILSSLKKLIKNLKLEKRAFLSGFIPSKIIGESFSMATIFASASEMEGFGISVLNAASSRKPIISSDLIPLSVQYLHDSSLIVPAGDIDGFAEKMKKYLNDEKLQIQNAEKSYKISSRFRWKELSKKMIDDIKDLNIV